MAVLVLDLQALGSMFTMQPFPHLSPMGARLSFLSRRHCGGQSAVWGVGPGHPVEDISGLRPSHTPKHLTVPLQSAFWGKSVS